MNGNGSHGSASRGASESGSMQSDESEQARPTTRAKGKRNSGAGIASTNGRRKADDAPGKAPASKKPKTNVAGSLNGSDDHDDDDQDDDNGDKPKSKMTEEEKRKNFLERNR
jgi:ATF/CREB family transcription factor